MKRLLLWLFLGSVAGAETRIAYSPLESKASTCRVVTAEGKVVRSLTNADDAALSPDGRSLVVTVPTKDGRRLEVVDLATGKRTRLPIKTREVYGALWSPAGDWLAFNILHEHWEVAVIHPDGTGLRVLKEEPTAKDDIFFAGWDLKTGAPLLQDLSMLWEVGTNGKTAWHRLLKPLVGTDAIASDDRFWVAPDGETLLANVEVDKDEMPQLDGPSSYIVRANLKTGLHERITPKGMSALDWVLTPGGDAGYFTGFVSRDVKPGKGDAVSVKMRTYRMTLATGRIETAIEGATRPSPSR